ncbi:sensor histidine kinase [Micromonospora sp. NPDC092111]|uniref:sensor histidine kinase n=1 Tax=Micromonospora sp. NPDC092111 TaxID=3364289 RepID=UPI003823C779
MSYAAFLVAAGFATLLGVYLVLRYVPDYPLTAANPADAGGVAVASRGEILHQVVRVSGLLLAALALIGVTGGWFLAGWVLRPLQQITEAARIAATGRLDHRIRLTGRDDEFRQVSDTFDHMLDRLRDAFAVQERFAANASHELRTPLAVTQILLDVARDDPDGQDYPNLVNRLSITNARAIRITEALLRLADANGIGATAEPVDLATVARGAVAENAAEADRHRVTVDARLAAAPTVGDGALLAQLATNLVQNAIRHNHSPGTARVTTHLDPHRATATLRVENTGAVYPAAVAAQLSEPFLRGSGRVSRPGQEKGYGLGLALVARITQVHGGSLAIAPRPGGGLDITVTLPQPAGQPGPGRADGRRAP